MNLLDVYSIVDHTVARIARFLPNTLVQRVQRLISRHMLKRLRVPREWLAEGPDGFQAEDEMDLFFGFGNPNSERAGCCSEAELIELANRRRSIGDPGYDHIGYCSPCYRRLSALQRLRIR